MGNVSGKKQEMACITTDTEEDVGEEYMECAQVSNRAPFTTQDNVPQAIDISEAEYPSSPISSYNNTPFTLADYNEKLPELPSILQHSLLDQSSSSSDSLEQPLPSLLNHLYIRKERDGQSLAAITSTGRFQSKYVTLVLYKPAKKVKN